MPRCGSQVILCDIPIRFDTYKGCGHGCSYCFVSKKMDIRHIQTDETAGSLERFIAGKRQQDTDWCDWDIPLHWGGVSDPFQPIERVEKRSLECLKVFAKTQYPFIVSTKNALIAEEPYFSLIKQCNCVVQFSACTSRFDRIERGASSYEERIKAATKIAKHKRVNIRVQPYLPTIFRDVISAIPRYAEAGIHGIIIEAMKYTASKVEGLVSVGGDLCYPIDVLLPQFQAIRSTCHKYGLKFYCGENRLRALSDELCCCGIEGMGWRENKANLNHWLFGSDFAFTENMKRAGTAGAWKAMEQSTIATIALKNASYADKIMQATSSPYPYIEGAKPLPKEKQDFVRAYFKEAQKKAGVKSKEIDECLGSYMWGHYIARVQFELPTYEAYEKLMTILPSLVPYPQLLAKLGMKERKPTTIFGAKQR